MAREPFRRRSDRVAAAPGGPRSQDGARVRPGGPPPGARRPASTASTRRSRSRTRWPSRSARFRRIRAARRAFRLRPAAPGPWRRLSRLPSKATVLAYPQVAGRLRALVRPERRSHVGVLRDHDRPDWRHGLPRSPDQRLPAGPLHSRRRRPARPGGRDRRGARQRDGTDLPRRGGVPHPAGPAQRGAARRRGGGLHRLLLDLHRARPARGR